MEYEGIVYRPPSESKSLIIQVTIGCSHNKCTFCSMYRDKKFRIKNLELIKNELKEARDLYKSVDKIFLADGDAFILKTSHLIEILQEIKKLFPECIRVSSYATPRDIINKSKEEIILLKKFGLSMLYMGIESGSDLILKKINKGVTSEEIIVAGKKVVECEIILSVTLISGLSGIKYWKNHAIESAKVVSEINPDYIGLLTLMIEEDSEIYKDIEEEKFELLNPSQIVDETYEFIKNINVSNCIFRSNHASNYIALAGNLNDDKEKLLLLLKSYKNGNEIFADERYRSL